MRKTLHLPVKRPAVTLAQYASTLPKPPVLPVPAPPPVRSKLFEPECVPLARARRFQVTRSVPPGTFGAQYTLRAASGAFDRPDKSEPITSLTFKWSPA